MRVEDKRRLVAKLHVERRIALIHARGDTIWHLAVIATGHRILHTQVIGIAEGEERAELQRRPGMGVNESVTDKNTVLVGDENLFLLQNHATHTIGGCGHPLAVILADVLVPVGTVNVALVAVQAKVERRAVLNHRLVQAREQHMVVIIKFGYRNHQQAMLLAGVTTHD